MLQIEKKHLQMKKTLSSIWQHTWANKETHCTCSQHNQKRNARCKYNLFDCVVSICSVFLYLFVLWAFAPSAVKMMKFFSWFAGAFSICMCFLLQRVELSQPPYRGNTNKQIHKCNCEFLSHISDFFILILQLWLLTILSLHQFAAGQNSKI